MAVFSIAMEAITVQLLEFSCDDGIVFVVCLGNKNGGI